MAKSKAVSPTPEEVEAHLLALQKAHPRLVQVEAVGHSGQGRAIYAAAVTAPNVPDDDKQHVLIVAGQHGNEESGRMLALATLDWLVSRAGGETRAKQLVVVMPCVNPDGAATDIHNTPAGVAPNLDHPDSGARSGEGIAVETVAARLQPELFVDMHACGYTGCSYDMVLFPDTKTYTEDDNLLHEIAAAMGRAGEAGGIPQNIHPLTWSGWGGPGFDHPSTTCWTYRQFKSLVFLTETAEDNRYAHPVEIRIRSGLAKMKALLAYGNRRYPKLRYSGYPCYMVAGMFVSGIVAVGATAAARRASRIAAWRNRAAFRKIDRRCPQTPDATRLVLEYDGPDLTDGVGVQTFVRGRRQVKSVRLDGRRLGRSETDGYYAWPHGACATYVVLAMPHLQRGDHKIDIRYR